MSEDAYKSIIEKAYDQALRDTVESVIREAVGYSVESEIKMVIKESARKMLAENADLQDMILEGLKSWINDKTADDYRKKTAEARKRYGLKGDWE